MEGGLRANTPGVVHMGHDAILLIVPWLVWDVATPGPLTPESGSQAPAATTIKHVLESFAAATDGKEEVVIRGVVTMAAPNRVDFAMHDGTGGIWGTAADVADATVRQELQCGQEIEVRGSPDQGGFAPLIRAHAIRILGKTNLPVPQPGDVPRLFTGADNCQRVHLTGIVQGFRPTPTLARIIVETAGRRLIVQIPRSMLNARRNQLVDSTVRIVGVVGAIRNTRGEFLSPSLWVARPEDFKIIEPPPSEPFESPLVPLDQVGRFRIEPFSSHRIQTEGVVTYSLPGRSFFLQQGLTGVRVQTVSDEPLVAGDFVKVAGFIDMSRQIVGITEALVQRVGKAPLPRPQEVTPDTITAINSEARRLGVIAEPSNFDGRLVTFPARLIEVKMDDSGSGHLVLSAGQSTLSATCDGPGFERLAQLQPDSELAVTGIIQVQLLGDEGLSSVAADPVVQQLVLVLRMPDDVRVLRTPSWWTPRRLAVLVAGILTVLVVSMAWVWMLKREVAFQSQQVAREISTRRDAALEFRAALRERNRLAANLHDTLLQTLAGIHFQLAACRSRSRLAGEESQGALDVAQRMVDHATQELRGSVWALRTMPMVGHSFRESLDALVKHLGERCRERITTRVDGTPVEVPNFVAGNLLLVIQEAIHNSLHHAQAELIDVAVEFNPTNSSIAVSVHDDGRGFNRGSEAGPARECGRSTVHLDNTPKSRCFCRSSVAASKRRQAFSPVS